MSALSIARLGCRLLAGSLLATVLAATPSVSQAESPGAAIRTITVVAAHPSFPRSIPAELLSVQVVGSARSGVGLAVARVNRGVSPAQARAASSNFMRFARMVTFVGGVDVPQKTRASMVVDLRTPGQYALHLQWGESGPGWGTFFAVRSAGARYGVPPRANVTVTMRGTRFFGLPAALHAGRITFKVTNDSAGLRKMHFFRLDPGKTVHDVLGARQRQEEPAWLHGAGGVDILSSHQTVWIMQRLSPGSYVADNPLPDPARGGRLFDLEGMIAAFTVS